MPEFRGTLRITSGVSELERTSTRAPTPLVRAPLSGNPFGRATRFLRQDRNLNSGDPIRVVGRTDQFGNVSVIVVDDAMPDLMSIIGTDIVLTSARVARGGGGAAAGGRRTSSARAGATKKGGARESAAKKSAAKKGGAKKSVAPKKGPAKKSTAKKSGGGGASAKRAAKGLTGRGGGR